MRILSIETSCDETALAVIEAEGDFNSVHFNVTAHTVLSQIDVHREYGGVFPTLAKREHSKNLVPLLQDTLSQANCYHETVQPLSPAQVIDLKHILSREQELFSHFFQFASAVEPPDIDAIAVTSGPGLEPALWVGINFAKALSFIWDVPLIPVNHMEGHVLSVLPQEDGKFFSGTNNLQLPVLALLVSGGHTELTLMREWFEYEVLGETRDDAIGEAFDKVARLLDLPYPGGPEISKLAKEARDNGEKTGKRLPRPMIDTENFDFSFSGLKTAVRYRVHDAANLNEQAKREIAREFEDAVADVLIEKTRRALAKHNPKTLIFAGGVSANTHIRHSLENLIADEFPEIYLRLPSLKLTGDNAVMIGTAGLLRLLEGSVPEVELTAEGHKRL